MMKKLIFPIIIPFVIINNVLAQDLDGNGIEDRHEQTLANMFCPSMVLNLADQGVSPEPVEIMGTDTWGQNLWGRVFNILGGLVGEYKSINVFYESNGMSVLWNGYWWLDGIEEYQNINNSIDYSWASGTYFIGWHFDWAGPSGNNTSAWRTAYANEAATNSYKD